MKWVGIAGGLLAAIGHAVVSSGQPEAGSVIAAVGTAMVGASATAAHHAADNAKETAFAQIQQAARQPPKPRNTQAA